MACEKCRDLNRVVTISHPSDLKHALRVAKDNVADKTIRVLGEETGNYSSPFNEVVASGGWDDIVHYVFACNFCGQRFLLSAETYHGSGGEWKPLK